MFKFALLRSACIPLAMISAAISPTLQTAAAASLPGMKSTGGQAASTYAEAERMRRASQNGAPTQAEESIYVQFYSPASEKCLSATANMGAELLECNILDKRQNWSFEGIRGIGVLIKNQRSNRCLSVSATSTQLAQQMCSADERSEAFTIAESGEFSQIFATPLSDPSTLCLSLSADGRPVSEKCKGLDNERLVPETQFWRVRTPINGTGRSTKSAWTDPVDLGLVGVSAAHQKNGDVLLWSGSRLTRPGFHGEKTQTTHFATLKADGSVTKAQAAEDFTTQFYAQGQAVRADGSLLLAGGRVNSTKTAIFGNGKFSLQQQEMKEGRHFTSLVTLDKTRAFSMGGWRVGRPKTSVTGQVLGANGWTGLSGIDTAATWSLSTKDSVKRYSASNMWLFALEDPNSVFHAGPSTNMHLLNVTGSGSVKNLGTRAGDDKMHGSAVMYSPGKLLVTGGVRNYAQAGQTASNAAYRIRLGYSGQTVTGATAESLPNMTSGRAFHNSVLLPDGQVLVLGGSKTGAFYKDGDAANSVELWNPYSGKFRTYPGARTPRTYESTALLLTDGRVMIAGGGFCGKCKTDAKPHTTAEIFSPPYLFDANGGQAKRPVITAPPTAEIGGKLVLQNLANDVGKAVLIRMSSVSHGVNTDQRRYVLSPDIVTNAGVQLNVPTRADGMIPGNYMLFGLTPADVPSKAVIVNIQ